MTISYLGKMLVTPLFSCNTGGLTEFCQSLVSVMHLTLKRGGADLATEFMSVKKCNCLDKK